MIINKITTGFVIQTYDTEKRQYVHQEFVAGDEAHIHYMSLDPEHDVGVPMEWDKMAEFNFGPEAENEPYLPFDMLQPAEIPYADEKLGPVVSPTVLKKVGGDILFVKTI